MDWTLYENLLTNGQSSMSARDVAIEQSVESFLEGIVSDPAYQIDAVVDGSVAPIVASRKSAIECTIKGAPGTDIHIGDYVHCLDYDWIVTSLYLDKVGIVNGTMWLCNDTLNFQNGTATVITRKCVVDDGSYSKFTSNPDARELDSTYKLYISHDESTKYLYVDKRISVGSTYASDGTLALEVYKIIGIDTISRNFDDGDHLDVIYLQRDVYNASTDNIQNGVCDKFVASGSSSDPTSTGKCEVTGKDTIRLGTTRTYTASFMTADSTLVVGVNAIWAVTVPTGITYTTTGNTCSVTIPLKEQYVGGQITISISESSGTYGSYEKKVRVISVG